MNLTRQDVHSAEQRTLLVCARVGDEVEPLLRSALAHVDDWLWLHEAAIRHGMAPMLHRHVAQGARDLYPSAAWSELAGAVAANERRNLRVSATLLRILRRLTDLGVPAVGFKGPVLADEVYGDVGMRQFTDLDILVPEDSIRVARDSLREAGFQVVSPKRAIDEVPLAVAECELVFESPDGAVIVELHWRTGPRFAGASLLAEELIARARPSKLLGKPILGLSPHDLILVLCLHGATHCWRELELTVTLSHVIAGGAIEDWVAQLDRAAAYGCLRRCLIGAILARRLAGVALPPELERAVEADPVALELAHQAEDRLFDERVAAPSGGIGGLVWQSRALDTPAAAARHLFERAVTPGVRDWDWIALPPRLHRLYYVARPLRMAVQYARRELPT